MLLYSHLTARAKQLIEILNIEDINSPEGLERIWQLLDDAFENMQHERLREAWKRWESAHRAHGQPMADWCTLLRRYRMELEEQDTTRISDGCLANKMLWHAGLPSREAHQVFYNSGCKLQSDAIETCLKSIHGKFHMNEKQLSRPHAGLRPQPQRFARHGVRDQRSANGRFLPRAQDGLRSRHALRPKKAFYADDVSDNVDVLAQHQDEWQSVDYACDPQEDELQPEEAEGIYLLDQDDDFE